MRCSCCGKRKKLFESFEKITQEVNVCVQCSTLLYKLKDSLADNNNELAEQIMEKIKQAANSTASPHFTSWFNGKYGSDEHKLA